MPSPFPGMDPWLEAPSEWQGMHFLLASATTAFLQPQLKQRGYYAYPGERVWLTEPDRPVYPDVAVLNKSKRADEGQVAVLDVDEPVHIRQADIESREPYIEIYDSRGHRLITGIEFVSPSNKSDSRGRELYQRKQAELRDAGVHLVEIDLIRRGPHILDVPQVALENLARWDYLVNLCRRRSDDHEVYPIRIRNPLPRIRIPLKNDESDVALDLQAAFNRAWEEGPFLERIDYNTNPPTPLAEDDADWADELLRECGLRA